MKDCSGQRIRRRRPGGKAEPCPLAVGKLLGRFLGHEQMLGHRAILGNQHRPLAAVDTFHANVMGSPATTIVLQQAYGTEGACLYALVLLLAGALAAGASGVLMPSPNSFASSDRLAA